MKRVMIIVVMVGLLTLLPGCVPKKSPLVGDWHVDDSGELPVESLEIKFKDIGEYDAVKNIIFGRHDYYGYGPSGTYGISGNKLVFTVTGGSGYASNDPYKDLYQSGMREAYPERIERYYEIGGDTLYLYETQEKKETPGVFLTGTFHRGEVRKCSLYEAYYRYDSTE